MPQGSSERPRRLVAEGLGRDDRKVVPVGSSHQCHGIPTVGSGDATPLPSAPDLVHDIDLEKDTAKALGKRLTAAAYAPEPAPAAREHNPDSDDGILQPLLAAGQLIGAGRSSYVAALHGAMAARRRLPGMLACEIGGSKRPRDAASAPSSSTEAKPAAPPAPRPCEHSIP